MKKNERGEVVPIMKNYEKGLKSIDFRGGKKLR